MKRKVGDLAWIAEWMTPTPGHEILADRGYRLFAREVEITEVGYGQGVMMPAGYYVTEPLGYSRFWSDSNMFDSLDDLLAQLNQKDV